MSPDHHSTKTANPCLLDYRNAHITLINLKITLRTRFFNTTAHQFCVASLRVFLMKIETVIKKTHLMMYTKI